MAPTTSVFRVQLVMKDDTGGKKKLKCSKRHGQLMLDAGSQSAQLVYPRVGKFFKRKFDQPPKCVMGRNLLRVYSSNGKKNFTCRLLSEEDVVKCSETLRSFGVEVIGVGESMLTTAESRSKPVLQNAAVVVGGEAALRAIQEASPGSMQTEIRDYGNSSQLQDDTEAIVRAMFSFES